MILACTSAHDLCGARESLARGSVRAVDLIDASLAAIDAPAAQHAFLRRFDDLARAQARAVDDLYAAGQSLPPLAGLAVSVKDLFDVAGAPTTAGSRVLPATPATADAPAVARLRAAGAAIVGHTNLSEFAFSGLGLNPHHGTPANPATTPLDPAPRVPGGSTAGGAVSVACGAAWAALGSDTGGSIRIPAALQGLVGFKNTQALTPREGCIPLATTLDTACAVTRSVRDAIVLHEILAARTVALTPRALADWRLAVPTTLMLDGLDPVVAAAFDGALAALRASGARIDEVAVPPLAELASLNAQGGFAAAESWAWHRARLEHDEAAYDPRVAVRIRRGASMSAADYIDLLHARRSWIARMQTLAEQYDAWLSPTVPVVAPLLAPLLDDDAAYHAANGLMLRNPSAVNFLDGCALSLPCQRPDDWPVGLMVWAPALRDDTVLAVALAIESTLAGNR